MKKRSQPNMFYLVFEYETSVLNALHRPLYNTLSVIFQEVFKKIILIFTNQNRWNCIVTM